MTTSPLIACTLTPGAHADRVTWIADLNRAFLRSHHQDDLALELVYAPGAAQQVRDLVQREQECRAFLRFTLHEAADAVRLRIEAPADARDAVDVLFAPFFEGAPGATVGGVAGRRHAALPTMASAAAYSGASCGHTAPEARESVSRVRGVAAVTRSAAAVVACGACCVLPIAFPAVALAIVGSLVAAFAHICWWALGSAVAVVAGWLWVGWQSLRARPSRSTLRAMAAATLILAVALSWPFLEPHILAVLKA